ncbi:RagB/SusD family nutrient uptake outer membrane protein [Chitinophaga sp. 212800010-3]|uniref:RagB/SusD family nutrient uptake outer membrane protein n=1 Tax=unclassified Chitinophaga TaxID=2619133 RepID=UPI002DE45C22|nr:Starch-binding associating with outer membrane [Chitinophaga sp. 212800010-3]
MKSQRNEINNRIQSSLGIHVILKISILLIPFIYAGCKKFVVVDLPPTLMVTENVFKEKSTAIAAVTSIYGQMTSIRSIAASTGLSSDELIGYNNGYDNNLNYRLYVNGLSANDGTNLIWSNAYSYIYQANAALSGLSKPGNLSTADRNQLIGESVFIRAFWLLYLTNLYGEIPIVTSTDYNIIASQLRSSQADVYKQIISDLTTAQQLLSDDFPDIYNNPGQERVRPTKWAATALLARTYLFITDYANAETQSSMLINNRQKFSLCSSLNNVFLKNSSEAIWQIAPPNGKYQTDDGSYFILLATPISNAVSVSQQLLNTFEPGDRRLSSWINSITDGGKTFYFPFKYKVKSGTGSLTEYSMILRLAEQYLIRAEARVQLNKIAEGAADLDSIRLRAGLTKTTANSKDPLLKAILHERQTELFAEGFRWTDLSRAGVLNQVMSILTPQKGGGSWQNFQQLYPIPISDIQSSQHLQQTPGY